MKYLSVCSGIEAATVAWHPLGWEPVAFSEVDAFPSAVLAHHYPAVPNRGDMTKFQEWPYATVDLLVGGTPCQSFSVAGLREGLADPRGGLMLTYLAIAQRFRPRWVVWENVPGVLSADGGRAFGTLLGGLAVLGYGFAYRVLNAQYFGLAQRRKRVFVVGCLGGWQRAAAVLFERASLSGHPAPRREAGQGAAVGPTLGAAFGRNRGLGNENESHGLIAGAVSAKWAKGTGGPAGDECYNLTLAHALRVDGFDASEDGTGRGTPLVPVAEPFTLAIRGRGDSHALEYRQDGVANAILTPNGGRGGIGVGAIAHASAVAETLRQHPRPGSNSLGQIVPVHAFDARQSDVIQYGDHAEPLDTDGHSQAVAFSVKDYGADAGAIAPTLRAGGHTRSHANGGVMPAIAFREVAGAITQNYGKQPDNSDTGLGPNLIGQSMAVRRLTPRECERLQGFPDDYTLITYRGKPAADGPRYKALGNSMAVPCMSWIGRRIQQVDDISEDR